MKQLSIQEKKICDRKDNDFDKWFAGFFDGEGCIHKDHNRRGLSIVQTIQPHRNVKKLFNKIKKYYGGNVSFYLRSPNLNIVQWRVLKSFLVTKTIKRILKYTIIRKFDLKNCLKYLKNNPTITYVNKRILFSKQPLMTIAKKLGCSYCAVWYMRKEKRNFYFPCNRSQKQYNNMKKRRKRRNK